MISKSNFNAHKKSMLIIQSFYIALSEVEHSLQSIISFILAKNLAVTIIHNLKKWKKGNVPAKSKQ